ncbi:hypothetical protein [Flavobacterium cerinum]|uniref:AraC family transcriptional regulator n=1 Tax=Flavobacterium cerinum TaxID=2502784 RepID=A0ABY5IS18_9FLAO|nr:hypothetical protein [Flavobacterium cerinum]UUC44947.1 hypothetical protein NOX80_15115 [Flavobacterium cerinum]
MTFYQFLDYLTYLSPALLLTGIGIGMYRYKSLDLSRKMLLLYISVALCTDLTSRIYGHLFGNNLIFIILFSLLELIIFAILYQFCFFEKKSRTLFLLTLVASGFIIWELSSLHKVAPQQFQSYSKVMDAFVILLFALAYFFQKVGKYKTTQTEQLRLNAAILIFFSLHLLFFLPINFLINVSSGLKFYFWTANLVLTLFFYAFINWEIWKNG